MHSASVTFSRLVVKVIHGLDEFSAAYLDDIISFSSYGKAHASHVRSVPTRLREAHFTLSPAKCQFAAADLDYPGHHIGLGRVLPCQPEEGSGTAHSLTAPVVPRPFRILPEVRAELCSHLFGPF